MTSDCFILCFMPNQLFGYNSCQLVTFCSPSTDKRLIWEEEIYSVIPRVNMTRFARQQGNKWIDQNANKTGSSYSKVVDRMVREIKYRFMHEYGQGVHKVSFRFSQSSFLCPTTGCLTWERERKKHLLKTSPDKPEMKVRNISMALWHTNSFRTSSYIYIFFAGKDLFSHSLPSYKHFHFCYNNLIYTTNQKFRHTQFNGLSNFIKDTM